MFHNRSLNNKIKRPHERYLRNIYNERHYNFINFLNKESSFGTHSNNIDALAIELYKVANDMSHEIMSAVFKVWDTTCYNLQHNSQFSTDPIHSVYNGIEPASYLGPKIWKQIPAETKNKESLDDFKIEIKKWKPFDCPCGICRNFVPNLCFI